MQLYLATHNPHKIDEVSRILKDTQVILHSAKRIGGMPEVEETGSLFVDNARIKAKALLEKIEDTAWILADDSGLEVDALDGRPGVYSARYAGEQATDWENNNKLLNALAGVSALQRTARFCCYLVLRNREGIEHIFSGTCEGRIAETPAGRAGFGYDPVFIPEGYRHTFAELGSVIKDRLSHRARALAAFREAVARLPAAGV